MDAAGAERAGKILCLPEASTLSQVGKHFSSGDVFKNHIQIRVILQRGHKTHDERQG